MSIHPEIHSIIKLRDEIQNALYQDQYIDYLELSLLMVYRLDPKDQKDDKVQNLEKALLTSLEELRNIKGRKNPNQTMSLRHEHGKTNYETYRGYFKTLSNILWENQYLVNEKYKPFELEEDKVKLG